MARVSSIRAAWMGLGLSWFLLFPSLGVVQKYLGTLEAAGWACAGALLLVAGAGKVLQSGTAIDARYYRWASAALLVALVLAFLILYPIANAGVASWLSPSGIVGGGSDRDEALNLSARALLAGRYPYHEVTQLGNPISPMPGTLILAAPFLLFGNVAWQNVAWFGVFLAAAGRLLGDGRTALLITGIGLVASPVIAQEFVTGGDLFTNSVIVFLALVTLWNRVPDRLFPTTAKVAAAVLAGVAFSSRTVFLLLLPLLFAALARRAGHWHAILYTGIVGAGFCLVTLPFYCYDPAAFTPLLAQNKFHQFETGIPGSRWLFPLLSLVFSAVLACVGGNGTVGVWLFQCGAVLTFPVAMFTMLATAQSRWPSLSFTSYALCGLIFGTLGVVAWWREGQGAHRSSITVDRPAKR